MFEMEKTIVVALGGNAILAKDASYEAQKVAINRTAKRLARLVRIGDRLVITHGNGPQVGNLLLQQLAADSASNPALPLDTLGAMTQGSIGYWLANSLANELTDVKPSIATVITQTVVASDDPAFNDPTKPIGPFYSESEVAQLRQENPSFQYKDDSGRGWRRVVPSPQPIRIQEIDTIKKLVNNHVIVIAGGGGGIPVTYRNGQLVGVEGVIDKDLTSAKLAEQLQADELLILTSVDHVFLNYRKSNQIELDNLGIEDAEVLISNGELGAGSMLPKVMAAKSFVEKRPHARAVITSLDNLSQNSDEQIDGTIISNVSTGKVL